MEPKRLTRISDVLWRNPEPPVNAAKKPVVSPPRWSYADTKIPALPAKACRRHQRLAWPRGERRKTGAAISPFRSENDFSASTSGASSDPIMKDFFILFLSARSAMMTDDGASAKLVRTTRRALGDDRGVGELDDVANLGLCRQRRQRAPPASRQSPQSDSPRRSRSVSLTITSCAICLLQRAGGCDESIAVRDRRASKRSMNARFHRWIDLGMSCTNRT
jgi:hypothetical protein